MDCAPYREQITAWVDGELLDTAELATLEAHLAGCEGCRLHAEAEAATKSLVAEGYRAPIDLASIDARVVGRLEVAGPWRRRVGSWMTRLRTPRLAWSALAAGVTVALGVSLLTLSPQTAVEASPLVRAAVVEHVACMMGRAPLEVTTTDQAEVMRWVRGRLARAVALPALVPEGGATISTRLAHLPPTDAVQIFFDRRGQMLSLFILPLEDDPRRLGERVTRAHREFFVSRLEGYTAVFWRRGDLLYSLVAGDEERALAVAAEYATAEARESRRWPNQVEGRRGMPETRILEVPTIKCEGCAETITAVVKAMAGVHEVAVDVRGKTVTVTFDPGAASRDAIRSQIRLAGF